MDDVAPIRVRIFAQPPEAERAEAALQGDPHLQIVGDDGPEVVVVDTDLPSSARQGLGVIAIAEGIDAEVTLHEPTAAELRVACRLLGENVRLRRRLSAMDEQRTKLASQAQTDALTGIANRRAWDEELAARCGTTSGETLCLAIADLDRFKDVNDTHGHAVGDAVLRVAAAALAGSIRNADFVARIGGDEFGLLLWDLDAADAPVVLERIHAAVARSLSDRGLPTVTASIGYVLAAETTPDAAPLFARADAALREAKRLGRDRSISPGDA